MMSSGDNTGASSVTMAERIILGFITATSPSPLQFTHQPGSVRMGFTFTEAFRSSDKI